MASGMFVSLFLILSLVCFTYQSKHVDTALSSPKKRNTVCVFCPNDVGRVSFSANVKANQLRLRGGETVIYDEILTNDGYGYDERSGVFTCPEAGTYMFVVDSLSPGTTWLHIYLNESMVATLHVSGYQNSNTYVQMSRTVILKLRKGDHVKVVNFATASGIVHHHKYSGFSGTMLY